MVECFHDCFCVCVYVSECPFEMKGTVIRKSLKDAMRKASYSWNSFLLQKIKI